MPEKIALPQSALELVDYPSRFPLKVLGNHSDMFESIVVELVKARCPEVEHRDIQIGRRQSRSGKYISLTITFTVYSQNQLEDIYRDLYESDHVVMSL